MLEWLEFVNELKDDIKRYCEQNKIDFDESISYLKSFVEKEDIYSEKGLKDSFIQNFKKMYDSGLDIEDLRNCIDRLTRYEPFLREICFLRFPDKKLEIKDLCAAELIKRLNLIDNEDFWNKRINDYTKDTFNYHLFDMYTAKNSSSHHWESFNKRELYEKRYTIAVFYIEVVSKLQNILRTGSCFPDESIEYYATYVDKNGVPFGIRKLTLEQVKKRNDSYKFIIKSQKIIKVIHINSLENPYEHDGSFKEPVLQEISYPDENTIKIKCTNSTGKKINFIKEYKKDSDSKFFNHINYYKGDSYSSYHLLNSEIDQYSISFDISNIYNHKANISSIKLERNADGFIKKELFLRFHGENILQSNKEDDFGYEYEVNSNGLWEKRFSLDKNGKRKKYQKEVRSYNSQYELEEHSVYNEQQEVVKVIFKYNDFGNLIQSTIFKGNKKLKKLYIYKFLYNDAGQQKEVYLYNGYKVPVCSDCFYHRGVRTYDKNGYIASQEHYGINGTDKVIAAINGAKNGAKCWKEITKYDEFGFEKSEEYYDCEENPILGNSGTFRIEYDYDESGNRTEERYYGIDGKLKCDNDGIAIVKKKYKNNELIEELNFDEKHNPTLNSSSYFKMTIQYYKDEIAENIEEISFFGTDSKPINSIFGYAKAKIIYNGRGLITDEYFFNAKGKKGDKNGLYHILFEYDSVGELIICQKYFDENENLINKPGENYAFKKIKYDEMGNITESWTYLKNNELNPEFCGTKTKYDSDGRPVAHCLLNANEDSAIRYSVDYLNDNEIEVTFFGANSKVKSKDKGFYEVDKDGENIFYKFTLNKSPIPLGIKVRNDGVLL